MIVLLLFLYVGELQASLSPNSEAPSPKPYLSHGFGNMQTDILQTLYNMYQIIIFFKYYLSTVILCSALTF